MQLEGTCSWRVHAVGGYMQLEGTYSWGSNSSNFACHLHV